MFEPPSAGSKRAGLPLLAAAYSCIYSMIMFLSVMYVGSETQSQHSIKASMWLLNRSDVNPPTRLSVPQHTSYSHVNADWFEAAPIILHLTRIQILQRIPNGAWPDPFHKVSLLTKWNTGLVYQASIVSLTITFESYCEILMKIFLLCFPLPGTHLQLLFLPVSNDSWLLMNKRVAVRWLMRWL